MSATRPPASRPIPVPATDLEDLLARVAEAFHARGDRMTHPRSTVVAVLAAGPDHLSSDAVVAAVAAHDPQVHRASVYRALEALTDLGIIRHVHVGHGGTAYHLVHRSGAPEAESHTHAQCRTCGRLLDLPADLLDDVAARLREELGFALDPTHVALSGRCRACSVA